MKILNSKEYSEDIYISLKRAINIIQKDDISEPTLAIISVGDDEPSKVYIRNKTRACKKVGIRDIQINFSEKATRQEIIHKIQELNNDPSVHGIMLQLPLPKWIYDVQGIIDTISPKKDVEGLTTLNKGKLSLSEGRAAFIPCTPLGIVSLLSHYSINVSGKHVVIVGRSEIVGKPLAMLMTSRNATVTLCHSYTENLLDICKTADILVSAVGKPHFITEEYVKDNAVVVDCGTTMVDGKLVGDVDFNSVLEKCSYITPVPKGVGAMTVASLMLNTYAAWVRGLKQIK